MKHESIWIMSLYMGSVRRTNHLMEMLKEEIPRYPAYSSTTICIPAVPYHASGTEISECFLFSIYVKC